MGTLYVVATPIGNLEDISLRGVRTLLSVPVVACEDTRRTGQLVKILTDKYGAERAVSPRFISVRDWNEAEVVGKILAELEVSDVALVSDAGTPLLSDPGFKVVRAARAAGVRVVPIPGPFAAAVAASAAGLPTNKIMFWGFLPKKWQLASGMTHVIYESPLRIVKTVEKIKQQYPAADVVIANELTKVHERIETAEKWGDLGRIKGEATILVYIAEKVSTGHGDGDGDLQKT